MVVAGRTCGRREDDGRGWGDPRNQDVSAWCDVQRASARPGAALFLFWHTRDSLSLSVSLSLPHTHAHTHRHTPSMNLHSEHSELPAPFLPLSHIFFFCCTLLHNSSTGLSVSHLSSHANKTAASIRHIHFFYAMNSYI